MPLAPAIAAGLWCPSCGDGALASDGGVLRCTRCDRSYPFVGTIPCLMKDPALWRALWVSRLSEFLSTTEASLRNWLTEAEDPELLPRTRARVARLVAGLEDQRTRVSALFSDLAAGSSQVIPVRPEPGDKSAILNCYEHLFRDWSWGTKETAATLSLVRRIAPEALGRLAVLGAGAGRLAVDVHQTLGPTETVALDENPLPLLVAERLLRGETVTLPECPVAPHSDNDVWIVRELRAPSPIGEGFALLFADALWPPFSPGALDAVLTPWFIDATRADFREIPPVINRILRPGGLWINVGPLRFKRTLASCYTIEEVWEIVAGSAFDLLSREREDIPYFDSPVSGSRRIETVFAFAARKTGEARSVLLPDARAPWIVDTHAPIPPTPALMTLGRTSWFTAGAIALIDGTRSMSDIANQLGRSLGLEPAQVLDQLRAFFAKLPAD